MEHGQARHVLWERPGMMQHRGATMETPLRHRQSGIFSTGREWGMEKKKKTFLMKYPDAHGTSTEK